MKLVDVTIEPCECGFLVTAGYTTNVSSGMVNKVYRFAIEKDDDAGNMAKKLVTGTWKPDEK